VLSGTLPFLAPDLLHVGEVGQAPIEPEDELECREVIEVPADR
jgi:hypothetical protein